MLSIMILMNMPHYQRHCLPVIHSKWWFVLRWTCEDLGNMRGKVELVCVNKIRVRTRYNVKWFNGSVVQWFSGHSDTVKPWDKVVPATQWQLEIKNKKPTFSQMADIVTPMATINILKIDKAVVRLFYLKIILQSFSKMFTWHLLGLRTHNSLQQTASCQT